MASPILKLRATKTPGEGWPICEVGSGWWLESDGMRASDVADAIDSGLGGYEGLTKVLAEAPTLRSDLARVTAERDALRAEVEAMRAALKSFLANDTWHRYPKSTALALDALRARKVGG